MRKHINTINNEIFAPTVAIMQDLPWNNPVLLVKNIYTHFAGDSLYRNSIYLMLSSAIVAFFGFFFWMITARLYSPENVGIATTVISVTGLIGSFTLLGLNVGIIRFLPKAENKNEIINSSFTITAVISVLLSIIFLIGLNVFSPLLLILRENLFIASSFVIFVLAGSLNGIADSIFIAYRSAKYTFLKNIVFSIVKLIFPLLLVGFSAYGIYASVGIASVTAFILSTGLLIYNFKYKVKISLNLQAIKTIGSYSFGNYIAGFLGSFPTMILPVIVANKIGAAEAGYFYIALMIGGFLFIIPGATTQSLFAEGSHREDGMEEHIKKSIKITALLLLPATILVVLLGNYILLAFGKSYSTEAFRLLQLIAFSGVFVSINTILGTVLKVRNKIKELIGINAFSAVVIVLLSYLFTNLHLWGIGIAWIIGQGLTSIIYLYYFLRKK